MTEDGPCHLSLSVNIPAAEVDAAISAVTTKYRNQVRLPGFRPGKTPTELVRKRFRNEIQGEARQQLMLESIQGAMEDGDINPVTMPRFAGDNDEELTLVGGEDFSFTVEFDVAPKIDLPDYKGLKLEAPDLSVDEAQVENYLEMLQKRQRQFDQNDDAAAADGDMLKVSYSGEVQGDGDVDESAQRLLKAEETWVILEDPEIIPGITEGLSGSKAGVEKTLEVTFPEEYIEPTLEKRTAKYTFTVHEVHSCVLPELNDEFAEKLGLPSIDEVRNQIRGRFQSEMRDQHMMLWLQQARVFLSEQDDFELPPSVLASETMSVAQRLIHDKQHAEGHEHGPDCDHDHDHGAECEEDHEHGPECGHDHKPDQDDCDHGDDPDHVHGPDCGHDHGPKLDDGLAKEAEQGARQNLKLRFLASAIAQEEKIEVSDEEIEYRVEQFRHSTRLSEHKFNSRYDVDRIKSMIMEEVLMEKVLSRIVEQADFTAADETAAALDDEGKENDEDSSE
jgi:trigger factor